MEGIEGSMYKGNRNGSYTRRPVTIEAMKVPRIANVMIAPKFEKNGFYKRKENCIMINYTEYSRQLRGLRIQHLLVLS